MSAPRRILDGGLGKWERQVVGSAVDDAPSAEFRRRMARSASVLATITAASGVASGTAKTAGSFVWIKLFGIGAIAGLASGGIYHALNGLAGPSRSGQSVLSQGVSAPTARASQGRMAPAAISVRVPSIAVQSEAPRPLPSGTRTARSEVVESTVPVDSDSTARPASELAVSDELRAIERVRGALSAGDASGALRELERYEAARHAGRFRIEADVLRIEALTRLGNVAQARALAVTFLSKHPGSPYVRRVSTLLGEAR
jgi:hypothetical protein